MNKCKERYSLRNLVSSLCVSVQRGQLRLLEEASVMLFSKYLLGACHVLKHCAHRVGGSSNANRQRGMQEGSGAPSSTWAETQQMRRKWPFAQIQERKAVTSAGLSCPVRTGFEVSRMLGKAMRKALAPGAVGATEEHRVLMSGFLPTLQPGASSIPRLQSSVPTFECPRPHPRSSPFPDIFISCCSQPASRL